MKKPPDSTKKYFTSKLNILLFTIFAVGVSSYILKSQIGSFIWALRCKSPVVWNNVRISFPEGIAYKMYDDSIWLFYWDDPNNLLALKETDTKNITEEYLAQFFKSKRFSILQTNELDFRKYRSFTITYTDDASKLYYKRIYIVPKNLCIVYEGEMEKYEDFKDIIENMEFL